MKLTGNTILITGGSSGIGLELARRFLALKNKVIITGRDREKLQSLQDQFPELDIFTGDLANEQALNELILFITKKHANLNILVNNAAVQYNYRFTDAADLSPKINYEIAVNLTAPVKLTGLLLPLLQQQENSAVVNVSSALFIAPKQTASVYCATKAALHSFTKTLRYQLENTNVRVFEIIPALIDTPMTAGRKQSKMPPEKLVDEFLHHFKKNTYEIYIGKTKLLKLINRLSPALAQRILKNAS